MTSQPTTEPDMDPLDTTMFDVADIESIAKNVIRKAPDRKHRWAMWEAYSEAAGQFPASSAEFPWDQPAAVTRVTARAARDALIAMLTAVPDTAERARLAKITARECERAEARMEANPGSEVPGKFPMRHCAGCGRAFRPRSPAAKFHAASCRQKAYKQRKATARQ